MLPPAGGVFVSVKDADKPWIVEPVRLLLDAASASSPPAARTTTCDEQGLEVELVKKVLEGRPHIVDAMKNGEVQLVFNTTEGKPVAGGQLLAAPHRPDDEDPLLHHRRRRPGRRPGDRAPRPTTLEVRPLQSYG